MRVFSANKLGTNTIILIILHCGCKFEARKFGPCAKDKGTLYEQWPSESNSKLQLICHSIEPLVTHVQMICRRWRGQMLTWHLLTIVQIHCHPVMSSPVAKDRQTKAKPSSWKTCWNKPVEAQTPMSWVSVGCNEVWWHWQWPLLSQSRGGPK